MAYNFSWMWIKSIRSLRTKRGQFVNRFDLVWTLIQMYPEGDWQRSLEIARGRYLVGERYLQRYIWSVKEGFGAANASMRERRISRVVGWKGHRSKNDYLWAQAVGFPLLDRHTQCGSDLSYVAQYIFYDIIPRIGRGSGKLTIINL